MEVLLERGGLVESRHRVHAAAVTAAGERVAWSGDPDLVTFLRSAAKPFQALPLVEDGACEALGVTGPELAVCCGSHNAEEAHLGAVRRLLERAGVRESDLECGPHPPLGREAAMALAGRREPPGAIHNNCSGKHAGMLLLARYHGWETVGYRLPDHPVQRRMLDEVARWTGEASSRIAVAVDGCGVACFALPVRAMALGWARLADAAGEGDPAAPSPDGNAKGAFAVVEAMTRHPFQVAGTDRLCTEVMEATRGRVVAKVGAEGVYGAADRASGIGLALKVEDGGRRACEPALLALLDELGALDEDARRRLEPRREPVVRNTRAEAAARLRVQGRPEPG